MSGHCVIAVREGYSNVVLPQGHHLVVCGHVHVHREEVVAVVGSGEDSGVRVVGVAGVDDDGVERDDGVVGERDGGSFRNEGGECHVTLLLR